MQVMIWTELKKLRRSRMLLVALFGLCMVLVIVTAQAFSPEEMKRMAWNRNGI